MSNSAGVSFRLPSSIKQQVEDCVRDEGYASNSAYILQAVKEKIRRGQIEKNLLERVAATANQHGKRLAALEQAHRMSFAAVAASVKLFMLYFPEPGENVRSVTEKDLEQRYQKFIHGTARIFNGEDETLKIAGMAGD